MRLPYALAVVTTASAWMGWVAAPALADDYCVRPNVSCDSLHEFGPSAVGVQSALNQAGVHAGPDRVLLGAATYTADPGSGFNYGPQPDPVEIDGAGVGASVLALGDTTTGEAVLTINNGGGSSQVNDLTVLVPGTTDVVANTGVNALGPVNLDRSAITANAAAAASPGAAGMTINDQVLIDSSNIAVPPGSNGNSYGIVISAGTTTVQDSGVRAAYAISPRGGTTTVHRSALAGLFGIADRGATATIDDSTIALDAAPGATGIGSLATSSSDAHVDAKQVTIVGGSSATAAGAQGDTSGHDGFVTMRESIARTHGVALERVPTSGGGDATIEADHNDYDPAATNVNPAGGGSISDTNRRTEDPLFVDAAHGDYRLPFASPLIDGGEATDALTAGESTTDRGGLARIVDGDGNGSAVRDIGAFEYQRRPPSASARAAPARGDTSTSFTFTGTGSDPDAGDTLTYAWRFDDGAVASGASAHHAFSSSGPHSGTLRVTDSAGLTATAPATVLVEPPFAGVRVRRQTLRVTRKRIARVKATCPVASQGACLGTLRLVAKLRRSGKGKTIGRRALNLAPGATRKVNIRLSRKAMKVLRHRQRWKVRAIAASHDTRGVSVTKHSRVTLKAPKRRR
jgi:hypothetical protein